MTLEQHGGERLEWPAIDLLVLAGEGDLGEVVGGEGERLPSSRAFPCLLSPAGRSTGSPRPMLRPPDLT